MNGLPALCLKDTRACSFIKTESCIKGNPCTQSSLTHSTEWTISLYFGQLIRDSSSTGNECISIRPPSSCTVPIHYTNNQARTLGFIIIIQSICKMKNYANGVLLCKDECTAELSLLNLIAAVEERKINWSNDKKITFCKCKVSPSLGFSRPYRRVWFSHTTKWKQHKQSLHFFSTRNGRIIGCRGRPSNMTGLRCCVSPRRRFGCLTSSSLISKHEHWHELIRTKSMRGETILPLSSRY